MNTTLRAAAVLFATVNTTLAHAQVVVSCDDIFDRIALVQEHEHCAETAAVDDLSAYFRTSVWPYAYIARVSRLPTDDLRRIANLLNLAPSDKTIVVGKPKPAWVEGRASSANFAQSAVTAPVVGLPLQCIIGPGNGHAELSRAAASKTRWTRPAIDLLAAASRDADDLEWENLATHALTPESPGAVAQTPAEDAKQTPAAIAAFDADLKRNVERAAAECALDRTAPAIYLVAQILHSVQDLALHAGLTRREQAYFALAMKSVEADPKRISRANEWTLGALTQLERALPRTCVDAMKRHPNPDRPHGVSAQYFGQRDRTRAAMERFKELGRKYVPQAGGGTTRWYDPASAREANAFYDAHVRATIAAALTPPELRGVTPTAAAGAPAPH